MIESAIEFQIGYALGFFTGLAPALFALFLARSGLVEKTEEKDEQLGGKE